MMTEIEELKHTLEVLKKYDLPLSPILEYAIKEKIELLSHADEKSATEPVVKVVKRRHKVKVIKKAVGNNKPTTLRIIRADGSILECEKATHTLCQAIKEIGIERVYSLDISLDGMNFVSIGGNPQYPTQQYDIGNGYYLNAHSCTSRKKRQLEKIIEAFNLKWKVEIVEPK